MEEVKVQSTEASITEEAMAQSMEAIIMEVTTKEETLAEGTMEMDTEKSGITIWNDLISVGLIFDQIGCPQRSGIVSGMKQGI